MLKLIAVCHYHIYAAFYVMDHSDILLDESDSKDPLGLLFSNLYVLLCCCFSQL